MGFVQGMSKSDGWIGISIVVDRFFRPNSWRFSSFEIYIAKSQQKIRFSSTITMIKGD